MMHSTHHHHTSVIMPTPSIRASHTHPHTRCTTSQHTLIHMSLMRLRCVVFSCTGGQKVESPVMLKAGEVAEVEWVTIHTHTHTHTHMCMYAVTCTQHILAHVVMMHACIRHSCMFVCDCVFLYSGSSAAPRRRHIQELPRSWTCRHHGTHITLTHMHYTLH